MECLDSWILSTVHFFGCTGETAAMKAQAGKIRMRLDPRDGSHPLAAISWGW